MNKLKFLKSTLLQIVEDIDAGNSNANEEELDEILSSINKATSNKMSKYQACRYLNISRSTFDKYVKEGKIPEGRKEAGFTEKFWYKSDLNKWRIDL